MVFPSERIEHCFKHGKYTTTSCEMMKCPKCQMEKEGFSEEEIDEVSLFERIVRTSWLPEPK